jgi:hypothetical protein
MALSLRRDPVADRVYNLHFLQCLFLALSGQSAAPAFVRYWSNSGIATVLGAMV